MVSEDGMDGPERLVRHGGKLMDRYLLVILNGGSVRRTGPLHLDSARVALVRGVFPLFHSFDDPVDLAYGQGLVTIGSIQ